MAKYIHNGLLYDTDKMTFIGEFKSPILGKDVLLYKTNKNKFCLVNKNKNYIRPVPPNFVKTELELYNQIDLYEELFGKLKEA